MTETIWHFGGPHFDVRRGTVLSDGYVDLNTGHPRCMVTDIPGGGGGYFLAETETVLTAGTAVEVDLHRQRARPIQMTHSPELLRTVAQAIQVENRPKNDSRNADQRDADEAVTLTAYMALARAALDASGHAELLDVIREARTAIPVLRDMMLKVGLDDGMRCLLMMAQMDAALTKIGANGQPVTLIGSAEVDIEIAPIVRALNAAGLETVASCSGHGHRPGNIALRDGREIIIARDFEEARKIDALFPIDINGDER